MCADEYSTMKLEHKYFFDAVRANDLVRTRALLQSNPSLANARILGDATLLNEQVWQNKTVVDVSADERRDSPALHHAVFHCNGAEFDAAVSRSSTRNQLPRHPVG